MIDYKRLEQIDEEIDKLKRVKALIVQGYGFAEFRVTSPYREKLECDIHFKITEYDGCKIDSTTHYCIQDVFFDGLIENIDKKIGELNSEKSKILGLSDGWIVKQFKRLFLKHHKESK